MATIAQSAAITVPTPQRLIQATALAWVSMIGLDLLMNAGVLAPFCRWEQPGLLSPAKMFQYIPLGYASFLLWCITLVWLVRQTHSYGALVGARFAAKLGGLLGGAAFLGGLSIFSIAPVTLFCWALDCLADFTLAGAVIGAGLTAPRLGPIVRRVFAVLALCVVFTIALQTVGLAPHGSAIPGGGRPNGH
jgi:hypothetical protein